MSQTPGQTQATRPVRRRPRLLLWLLAPLASLGLLLALALGALLWFLQPQRLTALLLNHGGTALGLELRSDGPGEFAFRPEPRLVLPRASATVPGERLPFFSARRVELALPWSTLRGQGDLTVTRLVLEAPELDVAGLQRWLALRPQTDAPLRLPTLTRGLAIDEGRVLGDGWTLDRIHARLPRLHPGEAARLEATLHLTQGEHVLPLALQLAATPSTPDGVLRLDALALEFVGASPLPSGSARGSLAYDGDLDLDLQGRLAGWPQDWPALPAPLSESDSPLDFTLRYAGGPGLDAPLQATVVRDDTALETRLVPAALSDWLGAGMPEPLPPLSGRLTTPRLDFGGVQLHGIDIRIQDDAPPAEADEDGGDDERR